MTGSIKLTLRTSSTNTQHCIILEYDIPSSHLSNQFEFVLRVRYLRLIMLGRELLKCCEYDACWPAARALLGLLRLYSTSCYSGLLESSAHCVRRHCCCVWL